MKNGLMMSTGGLTRIAHSAFQIFYAIETCLRRHLTIANVINMDEKFYDHLIKCTLNNDNVLFYWCMTGLNESDDNNQKCLEMIYSKEVGFNKKVFLC